MQQDFFTESRDQMTSHCHSHQRSVHRRCERALSGHIEKENACDCQSTVNTLSGIRGVEKKMCTNSHKKRKGGGSANAPHCARSASDRAPFLQMLRMRLELPSTEHAEASLFAPFAVAAAVLAPEARLFAPFGQLNLFLRLLS